MGLGVAGELVAADVATPTATDSDSSPERSRGPTADPGGSNNEDQRFNRCRAGNPARLSVIRHSPRRPPPTWRLQIQRYDDRAQWGIRKRTGRNSTGKEDTPLDVL